MSVKTNTIDERTPEVGVTIDGLLIKDGAIPGLPGAGITSGQAAALAAYQVALAAGGNGRGTAENSERGGVWGGD